MAEPSQAMIAEESIHAGSKVEKNHDYFFLLKKSDIYIDAYIYKLFQTCSIQIDLGTCLNRGYIIFAYIKTLDNVHKASSWSSLTLALKSHPTRTCVQSGGHC